MSNYRNRRLLDLAHKVEECMNCYKFCGGCEPAHANWQEYGKGGALKAHDNFHAALCHDCHVWLDQGPAPKEEKRHMWLQAHIRTMLFYFENGWLEVKT